MIVETSVPLARYTTLKVGGPAQYLATCENVEDIRAGIALAQEHGIPFAPLGEGSNVLANDAGYTGVVLSMRIPGLEVIEEDEIVLLTAGAGVNWDAFVQEAADRGLWGVENLAGIPGTVGAAPVQNIGAYGMELKDTLVSVEAYDTVTGEVVTFPNEECAFGYRDSRFKRDPRHIITRVTFRLRKQGAPSVAYADLARLAESGTDLSSPEAIGAAVRQVRSRKFPDLSEWGTAGSFFKNPVVSQEVYGRLLEQYPDLPSYPAAGGVKIPLAFVLDRVLGLRGHTEGNVSLFVEQPLVLVARKASAKEIDAFATGIASRVYDATGIRIEREVRDFPLMTEK